jgi:hypothetical protein
MNVTFRIATIYLTAMVFFIWGAASAVFQVFPYSVMKSVQSFVQGDPDENLSVIQKLQNDLGGTPTRMLRSFAPEEKAGFEEVVLDGLRARRDRPRLRILPSAPNNYRLMVGAFDFERAFWGAILMDPHGQVLHRWLMNAELPELTDESDTMKNLYGVGFFPDGSTAFTMQESSGGLVKMDYCSKVEWTKPGRYHHVAQPTEDMSAFWTFGGAESDLHPVLILIDAQTGGTLREIDMADVEKANPDIPIFDLRRAEAYDATDSTHPNHIEPLPTRLDAAFPRFSPGDLVLSYQGTNLVFVIDPHSLKIKWWYFGAGDGQHDPDWHADGTISIFNNRYRAKRREMPRYSTIVSIDPEVHAHRTVLNGAEYDFYSDINGHHEFTDDGTVIVTSAKQGRIFEVDLKTGEVVFDFVNAFDWDEARTLHVSEAFVLDRATVDRWLQTNCSNTTSAQRN